jgi:hypothetical protein
MFSWSFVMFSWFPDMFSWSPGMSSWSPDMSSWSPDVLVITCYVIVITWIRDSSWFSWSLLNYHWWKICLNCEYSLDLWLIQGFIISSKIVLNLKQLNWTTETTIESFIEKALNNLKIYYKFMSQFISRKISISNKNPKNFLIKI